MAELDADADDDPRHAALRRLRRRHAGRHRQPLGARALYLYRDGQDTYFRSTRNDRTETIGTAVSSGCIRLVNQDIIDLYNRVPVGAPVVVLQN